MPNFTSNQQDQLRIVLGYGSVPHLLTAELQEPRTQALINEAERILAELIDPETGIDAKLKAARDDSMASAVGDLKLSYSRHIRHLRGDGSKLLEELGALLGVAVVRNKYAGGVSSRSYW
jgi:hypothetical protein